MGDLNILAFPTGQIKYINGRKNYIFKPSVLKHFLLVACFPERELQNNNRPSWYCRWHLSCSYSVFHEWSLKTMCTTLWNKPLGIAQRLTLTDKQRKQLHQGPDFTMPDKDILTHFNFRNLCKYYLNTKKYLV